MMTVLHKAIYRFNAILSKCQRHCVLESSLFAYFRRWEIHLNIHQKYQVTVNKGMLKKNSLGTSTFWLKIFLHSSSNINNVVLAYRQIFVPTDQNRKPRNKSSNFWLSYFWQCQDHSMGKRQSFQQMMLRKLNIHAAE